MSYTQQAHLSENRLSSRQRLLWFAVFTQTLCLSRSHDLVLHVISDPSITTHMLRVRNKRVTAGLYLCEYTETMKQLYQHTRLLSLYWSDLRVVRHSHSRMPLHLHHLVERLSQHRDLILK